MRVSWIEYKGKRILFEDYSNLSGDKCLKVLYESEEVFKKISSPTLVLIDFTGSFVNDQFFDELKRLGKQYSDLMEKSACVGIKGVKKILATAYNKFTGQGNTNKYFDTLQEAKDYLVE